LHVAKENHGDYFTKYHPMARHQLMDALYHLTVSMYLTCKGVLVCKHVTQVGPLLYRIFTSTNSSLNQLSYSV